MRASLWQLTDDGASGPVAELTTTVPVDPSVPPPVPEEPR